VSTAHQRLALFTCADTIGQSQFNAWGSWQRIPGCAVSVFGKAPGIADHAARFGFTALPTVRRDEFGRPLLSAIFERMYAETDAAVLGYVNSDIILLPGLEASLAAVRARFDSFLIVARRWNIDALPALDFAPGWDERVRSAVTRDGDLFTPYGIDLFVFSRGVISDVPPFALGSDYWDNYLVMQTRRRGIPVIDVTPQVMLVHQDHPLGQYRSAAERRRGPEGLRALALAGDSHAMLGGVTDATHVVENGAVTATATAYVTVVVPHRGDARRVCRCLRSLEYQTYPQSFLDTIVVNTDPEAPLRYLEADFPALRVVSSPWSGPAAARNKGVSCATGEVVALFDSDIVAASECLERAMRTMAQQPGTQIVVCRVDPVIEGAPQGYLRRAVEWFDAVAHYQRADWRTDGAAFDTRAVLVKKEVFAQHGYFFEFRPEAASGTREWARRVIAAGATVAFCKDARVRQDTVKSVAEMKRKQQRLARGECILKSLERGDVYGAADILRDEWLAFRRRSERIWASAKIPPGHRPAVLFVALCSLAWAVGAKLEYRHEALRLARRRKAMERDVAAGTAHRARRSALPFRWLAARSTARRVADS
jgi:glycosyltransferase involved in cell wall biosynthesis